MNILGKIFFLSVFVFAYASESLAQNKEDPETFVLQIKNKYPLSQTGAKQIGSQIWKNESGQSLDGLLHWNRFEDFCSVGIGHFLWFPKSYEERDAAFVETFPKLLQLLQGSGRPLPEGLTPDSDCPWETIEEFQFAKSSETQDYLVLRNLLVSTIDQQTQFMVKRLFQALIDILKESNADQREAIKDNILKLLESKAHYYPLVDYVNFKGIGTDPRETYLIPKNVWTGNPDDHGEVRVGWGLRQVLLKMTKSNEVDNVEEFVRAAKLVLDFRLVYRDANLPQRDRWREGWFNRLDTYKVFQDPR